MIIDLLLISSLMITVVILVEVAFENVNDLL